jgi:hypothetical protein
VVVEVIHCTFLEFLPSSCGVSNGDRLLLSLFPFHTRTCRIVDTIKLLVEPKNTRKKTHLVLEMQMRLESPFVVPCLVVVLTVILKAVWPKRHCSSISWAFFCSFFVVVLNIGGGGRGCRQLRRQGPKHVLGPLSCVGGRTRSLVVLINLVKVVKKIRKEINT